MNVQYKEISCPRCRSLSIIKNGRSLLGKQRYRCKGCLRQFITDYFYQGCRDEVRQLIVPMTMNGSGVRDICRVLRVSINTMLKTIRQQAKQVCDPIVPARVTELQIDEMWTFVGRKDNARWLWYAFDPARKKVVSWELGSRTDQTCQRLLKKLAQSQVLRYCTDRWKSYSNLLPVTKHWMGKDSTRHIERNNLNFRTHIKRLQRETICY